MQKNRELKECCRLRGKIFATDWLADMEYADDTDLVQVVFKNTHASFYHNTGRLALKPGDWVVVEANPGTDVGKVTMTGPLVKLQIKKAGGTQDFKNIIREATESDMERLCEARQREDETMIRSRQIAAELGLDMKIGDVEYQGDGGKAIFYYIADERVDFRKLIRILADTFKVRIEMKQIGARQEAGRIGGIGPCGRPLCCSSWMSKFVSVGTGAARVQDLSMNPQKLAGQCGKLKCCINFETDTYAEASKLLPPKDAVLYTEDQEYYQFKVDILTHKVTYSTDKKIAANLVTIDAARAFEIIELNKNGIKVETLQSADEIIAEEKEYIDLTDQDSLTRFDKTSKRRRHGRKTKESGKEKVTDKAKESVKGGGVKDRNKEKSGSESTAEQRQENRGRDKRERNNHNQERNQERGRERGQQARAGQRNRAQRQPGDKREVSNGNVAGNGSGNGNGNGGGNGAGDSSGNGNGAGGGRNHGRRRRQSEDGAHQKNGSNA